MDLATFWRSRAERFYRQAITDESPAGRASALLAAAECLAQATMIEAGAAPPVPWADGTVIALAPRAA